MSRGAVNGSRIALGFVLVVTAVGACGQTSTPSSASGTGDDASVGSSGDASAADASSTPSNDGGIAEASASTDAAADAWSSVSLARLPVGDNRYVQYPAVSYVYSCQATITGGGGSNVEGPWFNGDGTFDFTAKVVVQGAVSWPAHAFAVNVSDGGAMRTVVGNDLPTHATGTFPIAASDPAHAYDGNPNSIAAQTVSWSLPQMPAVAATPTCLGGGPIGVMLTGAVLFDALDGEGRDAVAHEEQDACQAHPDISSEYHYHWATNCQPDTGTGHSALVGYARDGFGIYGVRGENGEVLTDADLDECHGHTHAITWDGQTVTMYHYHATYEFPYTLGCFRGTPAAQ
jgi:hypothetical protein